MNENKQIPRWFSSLFIFLGTYIILLSIDVIPYNTNLIHKRSAIFKDPHHWQLTCIGLAFLFSGFQIFIRNKKKSLSFINGLVILPCFISPMIWFIYFSGAVGLFGQIVGSIPLLLGSVGAVFGLMQAAHGKPAVVDLSTDPILQAKIYVSYGRTTQACQILTDALKKYPERSDEIAKYLEKIRSKNT